MRKQTVLWFALSTVFALAACGQSPPPLPADAGTESTAAAPAPASRDRDVTSLDVCALVPVDEVAAALGGSPGTLPPNGSAYPGAESDCWYRIARGSGRMPETVGVFLYPPEYFPEAEEEGSTPISDLGDAAFLSPRTDITTVFVLKKGVATVDARAGDADHAKKLAELVLAKLEEP